MPIQGGSTIIPGTANKTAVAAGRYVSGNVVVAGDSKLIAANIKKGVNIFGVTGTCEGYFPTATDLYLRGNNIARWHKSSQGYTTVRFETGMMVVTQASNGTSLYDGIFASRDLTGYDRINLEAYCNIRGSKGLIKLGTKASESTAAFEIVTEYTMTNKQSFTISANISAVNGVRILTVETCAASEIYIYRIWLS